MRFTKRRAKLIGDHLGIDFNIISLNTWYDAIRVEMEHGPHDKKTDVTHGDYIITAKIALAHLKEYPDYYERLEKMEKKAEKYWKNHKKPIIQKSPRLSRSQVYKLL